VSVIMPVYNAGAFLEPAVQSVLAQTLTDFEFLAIDDGSRDGSYEYLQRVNDPRMRVARNERNLGACATLNRLIEMARGRYLARMDADDVIYAQRLARQVAALEADPAIDVLGCGSVIADNDLNPVFFNRPPSEHRVICKWPSIIFPLTFGALTGKAEWWRKWKLDPRVGVSGYEFDLYFRSHRASKFSNVSEPLYVYRFVGNTRSWSKMTKSVYYKSMTLLRHGFRLGIPGMTLLGLATMAPRPLLYAIKLAVGSKTGLTPTQPPREEDIQALRAALAEVRQVPVPLKP
jgi:glycosyltransferase involved in cell wall biosynthesis